MLFDHDFFHLNHKPKTFNADKLRTYFFNKLEGLKEKSIKIISNDPDDIFFLGLINLYFENPKFIYIHASSAQKTLNSFLYDFDFQKPWASKISNLGSSIGHNGTLVASTEPK